MSMPELPQSAESLAIEAAFLANQWYARAHDDGVTLAERSRALGEFTTFQNMAAQALQPPAEDLAAQKAHAERNWQLARPIGALINHERVGTLYSPVVATNMAKLFADERLLSLREVLVAGSVRVCGILGLGPTSQGLLRHVINKVDPKLTWPEYPNAQSAASLYENLREIPAHTIIGKIRPIVGLLSVEDALKISGPAFEATIMEMRANGKINWDDWVQVHGDTTASTAAMSILADLQNFAQDFMQAKDGAA